MTCFMDGVSEACKRRRFNEPIRWCIECPPGSTFIIEWSRVFALVVSVGIQPGWIAEIMKMPNLMGDLTGGIFGIHRWETMTVMMGR